MIHLPHSKEKRDELLDQLRSGEHQFSLRVRIRDHDEKPISGLNAKSERVSAGSIQYDHSADTSRVLTLTIVDPEGALRMEHGSPAHGAVYVNHFVSVDYRVWLPKHGEWVDIPVFWGPLAGFEHDGVECNLEAHGKEMLLRDPHFTAETYHFPKGTLLHDAIKEVARRKGETRFKVPHFTGERLKKMRAISRWAEPWLLITGEDRVSGFKSKAAQPKGKQPKNKGKHKKDQSEPSGGLVRLIKGHYEAFFDGLGRLVVRKVTKRPVMTFKWGRDFTTRPNITYDNESFRNTVRVLGGNIKAKGKKSSGKKQQQKAMAEVSLKGSDPLSPKSLARNGVPDKMIEKVQSDSLTTNKDCRDHAKEVLKRVSQQGIDAEFECMPIPMLEENDWVKIESENWSYTIQLKAWTLPLTADEAMSIGRKKHVRPSRRKRHSAGAAGPGGKGSHGGTGGRGGKGGGKGGHKHHHHHHHHHGK